MQIRANGINIHCEVEGAEGAPWVVFSNSLATNLSMWDAQAAALRHKFRVLRYDQRGHGGSEAPAGRYTFDLLLADFAGLLDAFAIRRAHVVGLSMGGATVLGFAGRHPDRVDRVVACDTGGASTPESARGWEERIVVAQQHGMAALVEPTIGRWFPPETVAAAPPHLDRIRTMIRTTPVNGFVGCAAALADHDMRPAAAAIKTPVMFVVGEKDGTTPAAMRRMQAALPGSRYEEMPGAGHISNLDQPDLFNSVLLGFLDGAGA